MIKRNLDVTDRVLRFALAFWWIGSWAPQVDTPWLAVVMLVVAWIALIESFIGYCWLHRVLGINH